MSERCEGKEAKLAAWVDGQAHKEERRRVASHVILCRDCAAEAGHMLAAKTLLERGGEAASTPPPRDLWQRVVAELDRADGAHTALARSLGARPTRLPAIIGAGAILIVVALLVSFYVNRPVGVTDQLLAAHAQALRAAGIIGHVPPSTLHAVGTSLGEPPLVVRWSAIEKLNGAFAIHRLCTAGRLPVSIISVPASAMPAGDMQRVIYRGREMFVGTGPEGSVVVATRQGMATIVMANTQPEELLPLVARVSSSPVGLAP
ncbi:MAG: hypothetical protein N2512_14880 [Armatimonadetes bacterium]|nr:hypothetical protein [Armatimonadota bacterium]